MEEAKSDKTAVRRTFKSFPFFYVQTLAYFHILCYNLIYEHKQKIRRLERYGV